MSNTETTITPMNANASRTVRVASATAVHVAHVAGRYTMVSQSRGSVFVVSEVKEIECYSVANGRETFTGYSVDATLRAQLRTAAVEAFAYN